MPSPDDLNQSAGFPTTSRVRLFQPHRRVIFLVQNEGWGVFRYDAFAGPDSKGTLP